MFKKLIKKLVRKVVKNPIAAEAIAEKADDAVMDVLDSQTAGLASEVEGVVKRTKARRKKAS